MSRTGHLSNDTVSEFLADPEAFDGRARFLVLAHLSENNNNPDVARISAEEALNRRPTDAAFHGELFVASQHVPLLPIQSVAVRLLRIESMGTVPTRPRTNPGAID